MLLRDDAPDVVRVASRRQMDAFGTRASVVSRLATALAVGACGSTSTAPILNTERIERAIEQATLTQRNKRVNVSCPSGVLQKKGVVFTCTAAYKGGSGSFIVTETDGAGRVHYLAK